MRTVEKFIGALCVAALVLAAGQQVEGAIITVPTGLNPGDPYRLIFVTSTTTQATESSAAYYNDFVYNLAMSVPALAALNTTWTVAGNLNGIGPWENTGTEGDDDIPIYRLDNVVFAANYTALKGQATVPVLVNEKGEEMNAAGVGAGRVWTGMTEAGGVPGFNPANYIGAHANTDSGATDGAYYTWGFHGQASTTENHLYAMSGVIPEPATGGLILLGATAFLGLLRRKLHG